MYCNYYHVQTDRPRTWFVAGCFRSEENIAFLRSFDKKNSILEFFVTPECEDHFLKVINYLEKNGYVLDCQKLPNRLQS